MRTRRAHLAAPTINRALPRRLGIQAMTAAGVALAAFGPIGRPPVDADGATPTTVGEATTTDVVELRSGPGPAYAVLCTVPENEDLQASNTVREGYRYVVHHGVPGWMDDRALAWRS